MATLKQKRIATQIVENSVSKTRNTQQKMLENVGYSKGIAKHPKRVIQSKGVQNELKSLGFDIESAKSVIVELLKKGTSGEKLMAAREIFKVTGAYKDSYTSIQDQDLQDALERIKRVLPD